MKLQTFNRKIFLYVDTTNGKQYLDKEKAALYEQLGEKPDHVDEFTATLKTVPASVSSLGSDASLRFMISQSNLRSDDPEARQEAIKVKQDSERNLMPQTEATYRSVASAIVEWNLEDDEGNTIEVSPDVLKQIQPPWIYDYIREVYGELNEIDMRVRRD